MPMCPRLLHRRHDELGASALVWPAAGDGLEARVETHAFHAMHGVIREARTAPAATRHEGHGHRDGYVDAHHADFDGLDEGARGAAIAREHRGAVGERVRVDELDG